MSERVVLAFSGGIDSMTAAKMLQSEYDVELLTLNTTGDQSMLSAAHERASQLGLDLTVRDVREEFNQEIINYFIQSYGVGRTPAPCTVCNPAIKWRYLLDHADSCGVEWIATGHYFNVERYNGRCYVARADDPRKDQSYYLWALDQHTLRRALTPMGHIIKDNIRSNFSSQRESMGLCFLQGVKYRDYIAHHHAELAREGDVVDKDGNVVGRHAGVAFYTIGQKRGFECRSEGMVVTGMDVKANRLIVGRDADLYHSTLEIDGCNIVDKEEFMQATDISVVIRGIGRNPEGFMLKAEATQSGYRITLDDPAWAPAAGQPVVFYRQNRVIGGGFVERYY